MPLLTVPEEKRIWQLVAEYYRRAQSPWTPYAPDRLIGGFHMGTLAINFEMGVNRISLHNPWAVDLWPGSYALRVPDEWSMSDFHQGYSASWVAFVIGYTNALGADNPVTAPAVLDEDGNVSAGGGSGATGDGTDLPEWVRAYVAWLQQQIERYGEVRYRNVRPPHP